VSVFMAGVGVLYFLQCRNTGDCVTEENLAGTSLRFVIQIDLIILP